MYMEQFGLICPPFEETGNPAFLYQTAAHRSARETVLQAMQGDGGAVLITGEAGMGKSMLAQGLLQDFGTDARVLSLSVPPTGAMNITAQLCSGLGLEAQHNDSVKQRAKRLARLILGGDSQRSRCIVVIDQAENLSLDNLRDLEAILAAAKAQMAHLLIVLLARPQIEQTIASSDAAALAGSLTRTEALGTLTSDDVRAYIRKRSATAGATGRSIFTNQAVEHIIDAACGRPRTVNALCKAALALAAERRAAQVNENCVIDAIARNMAPAPVAAYAGPTEQAAVQMAMADIGQIANSQTATAVTVARVEPLIRRLQSLIDAAPNRLTDVEQRIDSMSRRAEELVSRATDRLDALRATEDEVEPAIADVDRKISEIARAKSEAEQMISSLTEFSRELVTIGQSAEERVTLLLTSLDAAQNIQDKLENLSGNVTRLVEDAERTTSAERDRLQSMFDELEGMRQELLQTIEATRQDQTEAIHHSAREIAEKLSTSRIQAEQTRAEAEESLDQTRSVAAEIQQRLQAAREQWVAGAERLTAITEAEQRCAQVKANTARMIEQLEKSLQEASGRAGEMLRTLETRAAETGRRLDEQIKQIDASVEKAADSAEIIGAEITRANQVKEEVANALSVVAERAEDRLHDRMSRIEAQLTETMKRASAWKEEALGAIEAATNEAERRLNEKLATFEPRVANIVCEAHNQLDEAINTFAEVAKRRTASAAADLEELIVMEKSTREAAEQSLHTAKSAVVKVRDCESRFAQAQKAAIDVEASAASAMASVQEEVKRAHEAVRSLVSIGVERVKDKADAAVEKTQKQIEQITAAAQSAAQQGHASIENALSSALVAISEREARMGETVSTTLAQVDEHATATCLKVDQHGALAVADFDRHADDVVSNVRKTAASAVVRVNEESKKAAHALEDKFDAVIAAAPARLEETLQQCSERFDHVATARAAEIEAAVQRKTAAAIDAIEVVGAEKLSQIGDLIREVDAKMGKALTNLREHITAADTAAGLVADATRDAERATAEARTGIEQINHLIRDVWSLTSTTDARARSLAALAGGAQETESNLQNLIQQAETWTEQLDARSAAAAKSTTRLTGQHEQIKIACEAFAERIAEAKRVNESLGTTNADGTALNEQLGDAMAELNQMIGQANGLIETIRADEQQTRQNAVIVEQVGAAVGKLESRLATVQEALASPLNMIQEARNQADELNDVCLSVKRIFRGVSQASLDANERIKMLGKLLAATERTSETMKQWVQEAGRAQERLAAALKLAPAVADTHPMVVLPDLKASPLPTGLKGAGLSAADIASMQRAARTAPSAGNGVKSAAPRATVLAGRAANAQSTKTKQRLSPEDVQALINAAKKKAPVQS